MANRPGKPVRQLAGERVGLLRVVEQAGFAGGRAQWRCVCDCGNEVVVSGNRLQRETKKNCGCVSGALISAAKRTHGQSVGKKTQVYRAWKNMKRRCTDPKRPEWVNYGGRGIKICDLWLNSFEAFYADVGDPPEPGLSLDRINNDGNYEPGNVRWATWSQQMKNSRFDKVRGIRNGRATLTEDDVRFIRASTAPRKVLVEMFGLAPTYISSIRSGKHWRSVE